MCTVQALIWVIIVLRFLLVFGKLQHGAEVQTAHTKHNRAANRRSAGGANSPDPRRTRTSTASRQTAHTRRNVTCPALSGAENTPVREGRSEHTSEGGPIRESCWVPESPL